MRTPIKSLDIGEFFYGLRIERDMTQDEAGKRSGTAARTVSSLETGEHPPRAKTVASLLDTYRASRPLTKNEKEFVRANVTLPSGYSLETPVASDEELTVEHVLQSDTSVPKWCSHIVTELLLVVGQERGVEILLESVRSRGIRIPVQSSFLS